MSQNGEDFARAARALHAAGSGGLKKELGVGIRAGVRPLIALNRAAAREMLPKKGGLNELVAKATETITVQTAGNNIGVRVSVGNKNPGPRATDAGHVRHPLFGDRRHWYDEPVKPGWFSATMHKNSPSTEPFVRAAMQRVLDKVERGYG